MVPHTPKPFSGQPLRPPSLYSYNNCVRRARGIDNGEPGKAWTGRIDQALPPAVDLADGAAVEEHCHRQRATCDPDRHGGDVGSIGTINVDPRAIERELDVQGLLAAGADQFAHG